MLFLSDSAIQYAVDICQELPFRRVDIVSPNKDTLYSTVAKAEAKLESLADDIKCIRRNGGHVFNAEFLNGSSLSIFNPMNGFKGRKIHLLVADIDTPYDIIHKVFGASEVLDRVEYAEYHKEVPSD